MKKIITMISIIMLTLTTKVYAINIAEAGETINQIGKYDSTRIIAGNTVKNQAEVDGLSIIAGNEIILEGSTPYGFYAGNIVTINENVEKDMFVAGNDITIGNDAVIGRDAYIAGNQIIIKTDITRDLRIGGETVDISGITIGGDAYIAAENIILDEETVIEGKLTYPEESKIVGLNKAKIEKTETIKTEKVEIEYTVQNKIINYITKTLAGFVVVAVLFLVIPSTKEKLNKTELTIENILKKSAIGFGILALTPIVSLIGLFTGILSPLALILIAIYIISIYISTLVVSYIIGNQITTKLIKKENQYLEIIIGIAIVNIIKMIPIIGGLITFAALIYGLGLIFTFIMESKTK